MDHSLRGYLERRSTEELETILNYVVNNYVHRTEDAVRDYCNSGGKRKGYKTGNHTGTACSVGEIS